MQQRPFHLAFPVADLEETRRFYVGLLGCIEARSTTNWVDFNLYGNSISAYLHPGEARRDVPSNLVDTSDSPKRIPVRHFGVVLEWREWEDLVERLSNEGIEFIIGPTVRFKGKNGEQATVYFKDPCGNVVEFKAFKDPETRFTPFET